MTGRARELAELRAMVGGASEDFWRPNTWDRGSDKDESYTLRPAGGSASIDSGEPPVGGRGSGVAGTAAGRKIHDRVELSALLWPVGDGRHARALRFKKLLRTLFTASAYALVGASDFLNAHIRANGRMLFYFDRTTLPLLLRFFFHGTRDSIEAMFQGVSEEDYAFTASRARLPSWMRTTTIERMFAERLMNKIVEANFDSSFKAFEFVAKRRLEALGSDWLPEPGEIWCEAYQRKMEDEEGEREEPPPRWSVDPGERLAPVLDDLFDLYERMNESLDSVLVGVNAACMLANREMPRHVEEAFARAQSLQERARRLGGDADAVRLAAAASSRADRLWMFEKTNSDSVPLAFPNPRFEVPDLVLNCETMRDLLLSLGVQVPSLEGCKADALGLFSQVFRIREHVAEASARERRRFRFDGIVHTDGKAAFVHLVPEPRGVERLGKKRQRPSETIRCDPSQDVYP